MRALLLPFFITILLIKNTSVVVFIFTKKAAQHRLSIVSFFLLIFIIFIFYTSFSTPIKESPVVAQRASLIKQRGELEKILIQQPNHRDILLNLARINQSLGDEVQSTELRNQAMRLDPNHEYFLGD